MSSKRGINFNAEEKRAPPPGCARDKSRTNESHVFQFSRRDDLSAIRYSGP